MIPYAQHDSEILLTWAVLLTDLIESDDATPEQHLAAIQEELEKRSKR